MCGHINTVETDWQTEIPDSPGEWLWIRQWSCGCVQCSGIAWVQEQDLSPEKMANLGNGMCLSWGGDNPYKGRAKDLSSERPEVVQLIHAQYDNDEWKLNSITAWRKILLPPKHMAENQWHEDKA